MNALQTSPIQATLPTQISQGLGCPLQSQGRFAQEVLVYVLSLGWWSQMRMSAFLVPFKLTTCQWTIAWNCNRPPPLHYQGRKGPNEYGGSGSWPFFFFFNVFSRVVSKEKRNSYKIFSDNLTLYNEDFFKLIFIIKPSHYCSFQILCGYSCRNGLQKLHWNNISLINVWVFFFQFGCLYFIKTDLCVLALNQVILINLVIL